MLLRLGSGRLVSLQGSIWEQQLLQLHSALLECGYLTHLRPPRVLPVHSGSAADWRPHQLHNQQMLYMVQLMSKLLQLQECRWSLDSIVYTLGRHVHALEWQEQFQEGMYGRQKIQTPRRCRLPCSGLNGN